MNGNKRSSDTDWVDPDDAPELTEEFFERADEFVGGVLVRRGRPTGSKKVSVTARLDRDVVEAFRASGKGWQTRLNAALKEWLKDHPQVR
jgi:uncharacterized protein (DUF4415 family)